MGKKKPPAKPKSNGRVASDKKPPGCYVLSLSVENVRCFGEKQTLDCSDGEGRPRQWTVILGDNGTGKTTLLKAMVVARYYGYGFTEGMLAIRYGATRAISEVEVALGDLGRIPNERQVLKMRGTSPEEDSRLIGDRWLSQPMIRDTKLKGRWALFPYDVGRGDPGNTIQPDSDQHMTSLGEFLESFVKLRDAQSWLLSLHHASKLETQERFLTLLEQVKTLLVGDPPGTGVLPEVTEINYGTTSGVFPRPFVEFDTPYGQVPLQQLGHGYQTMIAWVMDFVSRMVERYPDSRNPLAEPAVCLVDEIDLHLHPVWQRKVIGYLSERFPNTQFIVTAHSPLVVQAAASADANIAVLVRSEKPDADGNHYVEIRNNPEDVRNWRLDQILTSDLFGGLSLNPPDVEELFKEKERLLGLSRRTPTQKTRLAEIEAELAKLPVGDDAREVRETQAIRDALEHLQKRTAK